MPRHLFSTVVKGFLLHFARLCESNWFLLHFTCQRPGLCSQRPSRGWSVPVPVLRLFFRSRISGNQDPTQIQGQVAQRDFFSVVPAPLVMLFSLWSLCWSLRDKGPLRRSQKVNTDLLIVSKHPRMPAACQASRWHQLGTRSTHKRPLVVREVLGTRPGGLAFLAPPCL